MKTMTQVKKELQTKGKELFYSAMLKAQDKADVDTLIFYNDKLKRTNKTTLREMKQIVDIFQCYAEREM